MTPSLSIIIPCYNCEGTLREAVESCYVQGIESQNFEIVMVDDASTDRTRSVMNELANEHANITILTHEQNMGGGATRNTCVQHAQADVIYCLDSDDVLPAGTLRDMLAYLHDKKCDAVCTEHFINFNGTNQKDIDHEVTMAYVGQPIPFESLLEKHGLRCGLYSVFMFTKDAFGRAGGYPTGHGFDTQGFAWRFLAAGLTAYVCPNTFYLQRVNYKESYYLSEYNQGKVNHNWQKIFLEHLRFFKPEVQEMIIHFNCSDFTKNLFDEIRKYDDPFIPNSANEMGKKELRNVRIKKQKVIHRSSPRGLYLRIKNKLR